MLPQEIKPVKRSLKIKFIKNSRELYNDNLNTFSSFIKTYDYYHLIKLAYNIAIDKFSKSIAGEIQITEMESNQKFKFSFVA